MKPRKIRVKDSDEVGAPQHRGRVGHEDGVITSFNDHVVFVRYASQHPGASGTPTRREDLRWLSGGDR